MCKSEGSPDYGGRARWEEFSSVGSNQALSFEDGLKWFLKRRLLCQKA